MISSLRNASSCKLHLIRRFSSKPLGLDSKYMDALNFRLSDLISKLGHRNEFQRPLSVALLKSAHLLHAKDNNLWKKGDKELGVKVAKLCEEVFLVKAQTKERLMYSDEYKHYFLPHRSLTDLQVELLMSKKFDPKGFKRLESNYNELELQDGANPSDSLDRLIDGPSIVDCGSAVEIVFFKALKDAILKERFDALFSKPDLKLRITHNGPINSESVLNLFTRQSAKYELGARCYFQGHANYTNKHGNGIGLGLHAILAQENGPLYWGLGLKSLLSEAQVKQYLHDQYNLEPTENLLLSLEKAIVAFQDTDTFSQTPHLLGFGHVDQLSSGVIDLINNSSIAEIKDESFKKKLILQNALVQLKTLVEELM